MKQQQGKPSSVARYLQPISRLLASIDEGIAHLSGFLLSALSLRGKSISLTVRVRWVKSMKDQFKRIGKVNVFPVLSLLAAAYFFYAFSVAVGLPPAPALNSSSSAYLVLAIVFFLLPEVERFEMTKAHDYEGRLEETKAELVLLKSEIRTLMAAYNKLLLSVGASSSQATNLHTLPSPREADQARLELNSALGEETGQMQLEAEIEHYLHEEDSDLETALWDLRKVMDKELKRILHRQPDTAKSSGMSNPLSSRALFAEFAQRYPEYAALQRAFEYVLQICDAAVHGREIPAVCAQEAFRMGFRILDALRQLAPAAASNVA